MVYALANPLLSLWASHWGLYGLHSLGAAVALLVVVGKGGGLIARRPFGQIGPGALGFVAPVLIWPMALAACGLARLVWGWVRGS